MPATPHLITWKYNDWRRQSSNAARRARLILHIEEVEGFVLESTSKGRTLKLQEDYLQQLQQRLEELDRRIAVAAGLGPRGVSSFVRGSGP